MILGAAMFPLPYAAAVFIGAPTVSKVAWLAGIEFVSGVIVAGIRGALAAVWLFTSPVRAVRRLEDVSPG